MNTSGLIEYYHKPPEIGHSPIEALYKIADQVVTCYYQNRPTCTLLRVSWAGRPYIHKFTKLSREAFELKLATWKL